MNRIVTLLIMALTIFETSCITQNMLNTQNIINVTGKKVIVGNGNLLEKEIIVSNFNKIDAMSLLNIYLIQGDSEKVIVETDENIIEYINISVNNGILTAKVNNDCKAINNYKKLNVYVHFIDLSEIKLSGSCTLSTNDKALFLKNLSIYINGSTVGKLNLHCEKITMLISGASSFSLSGKTGNAYFNCCGESVISAKDFIIEDCKAIVSGLSTATIHATNKLEIAAKGNSIVNYYGNPHHADYSAKQNSQIKKMY